MELKNISARLTDKYGEVGSKSRQEFEQRANAFFTGQIIEEARKKANLTQEQLAERIGTNKSYISRVETGRTEPRVSTFYRIASALGMRVAFIPL